MKLCLSYFLFLIFGVSAPAQELWKAKYSCQKDRILVTLMQKGEEFSIRGVLCLDPKCYLIEEAYNSYFLSLKEPNTYKGQHIVVFENTIDKTMEITTTEGNLPQGTYYNCSMAAQ